MVRTCHFCNKQFKVARGQRWWCYKKQCEEKHTLEVKRKSREYHLKVNRPKQKSVVCPYCHEPFYRKRHGATRGCCYKPECIAKHEVALKNRIAERRRAAYNARYRGRYSYFKDKIPQAPARPLRECKNCHRMHDGYFEICSVCQREIRDRIDPSCIFMVESDRIPYVTAKALYNPIES